MPRQPISQPKISPMNHGVGRILNRRPFAAAIIAMAARNRAPAPSPSWNNTDGENFLDNIVAGSYNFEIFKYIFHRMRYVSLYHPGRH